MKIDAVAVASSNLEKTLAFYTILGFDFSPLEEGQSHIEPITNPGSARLMIDTAELIEEINGEVPIPGNHSSIAIQFDSPAQIDAICANLSKLAFNVVKEPWDAFWGQRYAIVADPDGYRLDLYCPFDAL